MKRLDGILSIAAGLSVAYLAQDFLAGHAALALTLWVLLPLLSAAGLWLAVLLGRRWPALFQLAKNLLVGAAATVVDLRVFEWLLGSFALLASLILAAKAISFLVSTSVKYLGNKYWAFLKHEHLGMHKEAAFFFFITALGLGIDLATFHYATMWFPGVLWLKASVIIAAAAAAAWNFLSYKFWVFKK